MRALALGALTGTLWLQTRATLPAPGWGWALLVVGALVLLGTRVLRRQLWRDAADRFSRHGAAMIVVVMATASGGALFFSGWAMLMAHHRLAESLPATLEGRDVRLTGVISNLPDATPGGVRFHFDVEAAELDGSPVQVPRRISLGLYGAADALPRLLPGQRWRFDARLKRPHGLANPQGFDAEAWWLTEGLRAHGNARLRDAELLDDVVFSVRDAIGRGRAWLRERIVTALPEKRYASVIVALVMGDQRAVAASDWELFNRTGIGHLVSISGLHITMIAALAAAIAHWLWRHSMFTGGAWPLRMPAQHVAAGAGLLAAGVYVALAGFGIPAQRTLWMLAVAAAASWSARVVPASQVLACALLAVLLPDPWAVLWPGFWLSFCAIACILFATSGRSRLSGDAGWRVSLAGATQTQAAVTLGLLPLTMLMFGQVSLVSPLANALAIPVVSFVVTPLALLGSVLPAPLCDWLLLAAHTAFDWLASVLDWLAAWPLAVWQTPLPGIWATILAMVGTLWVLLPRGWPLRWIGILAWLPLLVAQPASPTKGLWLTAFDVGQGNAVLVETANFRLLYDTGPAYSTESDSGSRVILPYLRSRGIDRLDALVISHSDTDHAGGARSLLQSMAVGWVTSSLPLNHPLVDARHVGCIAGQYWQVDGVRFEFLHPLRTDDSNARQNVRPNARSCTLKISVGNQAVLLAGDIEAAQERALVARAADSLRADILLAPHHGSGTSSTPAFLDAVSPQLALFQVGYRNRYRHPKTEVVERYQQRGVHILRSDSVGAVTLRMDGHTIVAEAPCAKPRYWSSRRCSDAQMPFAHDRPD